MRKFNRGRLALLGPAIGFATLAGCGETTVNTPLPPARVEAVATTAPSGAAGTVLPNPVEVRVLGSDNQPLAGVTVAFAVDKGGTVTPASAVSDVNGIAATQWKLGNTAGPNVLTSTAGGVSTTITATATAGRAANVALVAGDNQTVPASGAAPIAPSVRVTDAFNNLVAGAPVSFTTLAGGGRVTGGLVLTNAQGIATVGSWIMGPTAGEQTLAARVEENGVTNNPVLFTATATAPAGGQMAIQAGNNQQSPVGQLVPIAPTVIVRTNNGTPVPGVVVTFAVASGGGQVIGSRQTTDATGTASVGGWILGNLPGANTLTASAAGVPNVTFTATAVGGTPVTMVGVSQLNQTAPANSNVADPPSVVVRDAGGVPVPGVVVTFTVVTGGGTVVGSPVTTNGTGIATLASWKLGAIAGPNSVRASATGLPQVTFNAIGTAGAAAAVAIHAGDNQTAVQGTTVATQPTVRVTDAGGNPVAGAVVTFLVTSGGGTATGVTQITDALGLASVFNWALGAGAPNTLRATVTGAGITGNPVTFTAQSATQITISAAPAGPIALGANFTVTVQLRNSAGVAVALPNVPLTIAIATGGGVLNGTLTRFTDAAGVVSFTAINVTGAAGARTFTISGPGLTSATTAAINFN
jgi:adhesin/invasin